MKNKDMVLVVFAILGTIYGRTFIQKLFFLLDKEFDLKLGYVPYHYGPYSRELDNIIRTLKQEKLILEKISYTRENNICRKFMLTKAGLKAAESKVVNVNKLKIFVENFRNATPSQILKYVYEEYPDMTINSVLLENNLISDDGTKV